MKLSLASIAALALVSSQQTFSVSAFVAPSSAKGFSSQLSNSSLQMSSGEEDSSCSSMMSRRNLLATSAAAAAFAALVTAPSSANAGLLDEFGADPTKIVQETTASSSKTTPVVAVKKAESTIEPNLRSNYYYPTNKKRYLPRIKKCSDEISVVATALGNDEWEAVSDFATKVADDTILPLKLYSSSLTGGGTNVKVSYIQTLNTAAADFEKSQKRLTKATAKQDREASTEALQAMSEALSTYRSAAGLSGDFADLPSVDDIRRASCRLQGRYYETKKGGTLVREDTGTAQIVASRAAAAAN